MNQVNQSNAATSPVVVITGGSMGLGFALAKKLLEKGFRVSICARTEQQLQDAAHRLSRYGDVRGYAGDIADERFQYQFIDETVRSFGRLDAVVNNASTLGETPLPALKDTTVNNFRRVFEVNTFAPVLFLQKALPHLTKQSTSLTIGISSDAALGGYPNWGVYGASKAALDLLHKTLASEQEESQLTVYSIDPSDMATAMHEAAIPGDTGLADPMEVANAIAPLFDPLQTSGPFPFTNGARLQVKDGSLAAREVF